MRLHAGILKRMRLLAPSKFENWLISQHSALGSYIPPWKDVWTYNNQLRWRFPNVWFLEQHYLEGVICCVCYNSRVIKDLFGGEYGSRIYRIRIYG